MRVVYSFFVAIQKVDLTRTQKTSQRKDVREGALLRLNVHERHNFQPTAFPFFVRPQSGASVAGIGWRSTMYHDFGSVFVRSDYLTVPAEILRKKTVIGLFSRESSLVCCSGEYTDRCLILFLRCI